MQGYGVGNPFKQAIAKPEKQGPEHNPWFWNPNRGSIRTAPPSFMERLKDHPTIQVTWNPIMERWLVWDKADRINHPLCQGWRLLFIHKDESGEYLPLDERLLARLYFSSADAHGSSKAYFGRVVDEMNRDREKAEAASLDDSIQHAMESFDYSQIKNIGKGSKFSTYHQ